MHCTTTAKKCTKKRDAHACKVVILPILNYWFFAVLVQILSPGTALQLRKPIYNSVNKIYKYTTRHPTLHVELNSVNSP